MSLDPKLALDLIHRALSVPFEWSSDTIDQVGEIVRHAGYTFPTSEEVRELENAYKDRDFVPLEELVPWTPTAQ